MPASNSSRPDPTARLSADEVDAMAREFLEVVRMSRSGKDVGDLWWSWMGRGEHAAYDRFSFTDADLRRVQARFLELRQERERAFNEGRYSLAIR